MLRRRSLPNNSKHPTCIPAITVTGAPVSISVIIDSRLACRHQRLWQHAVHMVRGVTARLLYLIVIGALLFVEAWSRHCWLDCDGVQAERWTEEGRPRRSQPHWYAA